MCKNPWCIAKCTSKSYRAMRTAYSVVVQGIPHNTVEWQQCRLYEALVIPSAPYESDVCSYASTTKCVVVYFE